MRNQISNVPGASVPQPYGGTYRQIQIYVDPLKMEARNLSLSDVVSAVDSSNLILPAGDVRIGNKDFNIYANSQFPTAEAMNQMPLKSVGNGSVLVADIGHAVDAGALQYNIVRINGQRSVYVPVFKQGGNSNTLTIVNGMKQAIKHLVDIPESLKTAVVFDQAVFVKLALNQLVNEAVIGLVLTGIMILLFLGSPRATVAVMLSVPLSALACMLMANMLGGTINTMILGGLALAFSRLIDNGVVVLENIFRYMELGEPTLIAAEKGGTEVSLAVLAATVTTSIVFLPVVGLSGVSKYLFTPLALGVVLSMFASYAFAMTVIPLFCALFLKGHGHGERDDAGDLVDKHEEPRKRRFGLQPIVAKFNEYFQRMVTWYEGLVRRSLLRPGFTTAVILAGCAILLVVTFPFLGQAYFPRTDPGQFIINVRMPSGTRLEVSNDYIARVEKIIREEVKPKDLDMIVSNIGVYPDLSSIFTSNASMDTAFVQTSLKEGHSIGSYEYMQRVQERLSREMPELTTYFQAGGLIDGVINQGLPAPIDVQVSSSNMEGAYQLAEQMAAKIRTFPNVSATYIPQDINYPGIQLNIDREKASLIGLSAKDVVDNVITALTSDGMVAPSYWIDPRSGNNYMVTVQYANRWIQNMSMQDFESIPLRGMHPPGSVRSMWGETHRSLPVDMWTGDHRAGYTPLSSVADIRLINTPTEVDHYQIRRVIDVYVATKSEALGRTGARVRDLIAHTPTDRNTRILLHGAVVSMNEAFQGFRLRIGACGSAGLSGADGAVHFVHRPVHHPDGDPARHRGRGGAAAANGRDAEHHVADGHDHDDGHRGFELDSDRGLRPTSCTTRGCRCWTPQWRRARCVCGPILMTSMATLLGMIPMAIGAEAGSEQYAPLARAVIGGLGVSVVVTMFLVPAVYLASIRGRNAGRTSAAEPKHENEPELCLRCVAVLRALVRAVGIACGAWTAAAFVAAGAGSAGLAASRFDGDAGHESAVAHPGAGRAVGDQEQPADHGRQAGSACAARNDARDALRRAAQRHHRGDRGSGRGGQPHRSGLADVIAPVAARRRGHECHTADLRLRPHA